MDYIALYRKYRPQGFSSLVGQDHIRAAISNALLHNRLAHAYLFAGPRGTGKTSAAKILAKAVNCDKGFTPEPCNACLNCRRINKDASMDVFEINAASNRNIEMIRDLQENICFSPVEGRKRVYIVDEAHMLTSEAFNALLKTLEEPPEHVLFILATTEPYKIPPTILSRCQRYDFRRLSMPDMIARLEEVARGSGLKATPGALALIASQADGGMRDALSLLDQCSVMAEEEINEETLRSLLGLVRREELRALVEAIGRRDERRALEALAELLLGGADIKQLLAELGGYFRALMLRDIYKEEKAPQGFSDIYLADAPENLDKVAPLFSREQIAAAGRRLHEAAAELRLSVQPRITAELCLLELCRLREELERVDLLARIERLESLLREGIAGTGRRAAGGAALPAAKEKAREILPESARKPEATPEGARVAAPQAAPSAAKEKAREISPESARKQEAAPEGVRVAAPQAAPPAAKEKTIDTAAGVWEQTLRGLIERKKGSLYAYALKGRPAAFAGGRLKVEFDDDHFLQKLKKDEYFRLLEEILSGVTGRPTALELAGCAPAPEGEGQSPPPAQADELPPAVRDALAVFGGKLYKR